MAKIETALVIALVLTAGWLHLERSQTIQEAREACRKAQIEILDQNCEACQAYQAWKATSDWNGQIKIT